MEKEIKMNFSLVFSGELKPVPNSDMIDEERNNYNRIREFILEALNGKNVLKQNFLHYYLSSNISFKTNKDRAIDILKRDNLTGYSEKTLAKYLTYFDYYLKEQLTEKW